MSKKKITSMKELKKIPENYSKDLINEINSYFEKFEIDNLGKDYYSNFGIKLWNDVYEELKIIFRRYYYINDDNYDLDASEDVRYGGGFCLLNLKYKDKYIKDVYKISIKSAYPQKINKLFIEGMESNDAYFPYIFNLVYQHIGKRDKILIINLFINFTYGALTISKEKYHERFNYLPRVDRDLKKHVSLYYKEIMSSIDKKLYYYIDTDTIFLKKENIEIVSNILNDLNIEYDIEKPKNYLFISKKKYIEIKDNEVKKIKGLKKYIMKN